MSTYTYTPTITGGGVRKETSFSSGSGTSISYSLKSIQNAHWECITVNDSNTYRLYTEQVMYIQQTNELPDYITDTETTINSILLEFNFVCGSSVSSGDYNVFFRGLDNTVSATDAESAWGTVTSGGTYASFGLSVGETKKIIRLTKSTSIENYFKYGFAIGFTTSGEMVEGFYKYVIFNSMSVTIDFKSTKLPPEIEITGPSADNYNVITDPVTLTWNYTQSADAAPERFEIYYEDENGWQKWAQVDGSTRSAEVYAFMLSRNTDIISGSVNVMIRGYISETIYGDSPPFIITVYFVDCTALQPSGGVIQMSADVIRMKWKIVPVSGAPENLTIDNLPANYQIQYSVNGGESWAVLADNITAEMTDGLFYYDVPANTFQNGIIIWRVNPWIHDRIYNSYVKETFVVRVQASTSAVTCDGKPQPTLSWTSSSQMAYQVRFSDYDSGAIYGTETSYTVPYYYADGNYPVQVRTQASNGVWSAWTELEYVTITNESVDGNITLAALVSRHAVVLSWTPSQEYINYILYRNGIPVYVGDDLTYTDLAANGNAVYTLRGVESNGFYTQSDTVTVDATPKTDCMYDMESQSWIPLKLSLSARTRSYDNSVQTYYKYYAGRTKPVAFTEGNMDRRLSVSYVFKTREEAERILNLAGKLVIYKDTNGGVIIGILSDPGYQSERVYPVSFNITEIDYNEAVKYEAVGA